MGQFLDKKNREQADLRAALLNWYPFTEGKRALVLGRNTEPLLGLMSRSFEETDKEPSTGKLYDCIVAADLVEETDNVPALLSRLYPLLGNDGVFLLFFRNRFGIKYLCGAVDEFIRIPFSYLPPSDGTIGLYSRNEMDKMLRAAGFDVSRYYYLMPDSSFVQAVYTDEHLPDDSIRDRVMPFDLYDSPFVAWEGDLYDDIVREGVFPFTANVYLAECRRPGYADTKKHAVFAALSTDRGEKNGFATVLYSDGTALKKPLSPKGMETLKRICSNAELMQEKGLLTVSQSLTAEGIEMPLIREESLLHYLRRKLDSDPDEFLAVFREIEKDVLLSSPVSSGIPEDTADIWGSDADKLGTVLDNAMIDMIPYNAFRADGRIRYYDQEFNVENCPAKYVLFRALFYTWIHIPEAEKVFPLDSVKEMFGLTELWEGFMRREMWFVSDNRKWDSYAEIYAHNSPDRKEIEGRRRELVPSAQLREVHAVQLELLKELDRVCRTLDLKYMAIHGTLLGAVRHSGFIPWDYDVDIAMPREDYERLLISTEYFRPGFFLQTASNNRGCYYGGYVKLRRDGTAAYEEQNQGKPAKSCHQGIWVDIFPLDRCPADEDRRERLQKRISFLQRIVYAKVYPLKRFVPDDVPGSAVSLYYLLAKCTLRRRLLKRIDDLCRNRGDSPYRAILECYYGSRKNGNVWPAEAVADTMEMPFEDMSIPVPTGWKEILLSRYGENYMTPVRRKNRMIPKKILFITDTEKAKNE